MNASKLETWVWVLIYGGIVGVIVGAFTLSFDEVLGHSLIWSGVAVAAVGAIGIWVRSRMRHPAPGEKARP